MSLQSTLTKGSIISIRWHFPLEMLRFYSASPLQWWRIAHIPTIPPLTSCDKFWPMHESVTGHSHHHFDTLNWHQNCNSAKETQMSPVWVWSSTLMILLTHGAWWSKGSAPTPCSQQQLEASFTPSVSGRWMGNFANGGKETRGHKGH